MKAIVSLVGMMLVALAGTARAEVDCAKATTFTPDELKKCLAKWGEGAAFPGAFDANHAVSGYSRQELGELRQDAERASEALANSANSAAEDTKGRSGDALTTAEAAAASAKTKSERAAQLLKAVLTRINELTFNENNCDQDRKICLDRDGKPYSSAEKMNPFLLPDDKVVILVLSEVAEDDKAITLTARNVRRATTSFDKEHTKPTVRGVKLPEVVKWLEATVAPDSAFLEIEFKRVGGGSAEYSIRVESRRHYIEFGLMLPFAYQREVTPQGAVKYGMEPDLAFTISVFPGARSSSEPWQSRVASWFGLMAGADLTNQVSDKRYYLGLDFSPVSGLALNAGLAILPWEYVPNPEQVPDVLTGDIEPDQRYRASFFFGARMTPEVFDTVKAAYKALNQ